MEPAYFVYAKQCRLCVTSCNESKSLYDTNGRPTELYSIISEQFHPTVVNLEVAKHLTIVCQQCCQAVYNTHNFQASIQVAQIKLHSEQLINPLSIKKENDEAIPKLVPHHMTPKVAKKFTPIYRNNVDLSKRQQNLNETNVPATQHFLNITDIRSEAEEIMDKEASVPSSMFTATASGNAATDINEKDLSTIPNQVTLKLLSFFQKQDEINTKIFTEMADIKETIINQTAALATTVSDQIYALDTSFRSHYESPKYLTYFPITSEEDLMEFENMITSENTSEIVSSLKMILGHMGLRKGLSNIFATNILLDYNTHGIHGKKRFMDFEKTLKVLYLAAAADGESESKFITDLQKAIKAAKNKHYKNVHLKRKLDESNFQPPDSD